MLVRATASTLRWAVFVLLLGCTVGWITFGWGWCHGLEKDPATTWIDDLVARVRKDDPETAAKVEVMRAGTAPAAYASVLRMAEERAQLKGIRDVVGQAKGNQPSSQLQMISLASRPNLFSSPLQRDSFVQANAAAIQVFEASGDLDSANDYAEILNKAAAVPSDWQVVRDDPVALLVFDRVKQTDLRKYYLDEKSWLDELLPQLIQRPGSTGKASEPMAAVLKMAKTFHPLPRQAIVDAKLGVEAFVLFLEYGELIRCAVHDHGLKLDEVLEVLFGNLDILETRKANEADAARTTAAWLRDIYVNQRHVWDSARFNALALRLHSSVPAHADNVLRRFGADDVATMLFANFENEIVSATKAVDYFGDLAVYVLVRYASDERFHRALANPRIAARAVPYVAAHGDGGLDGVLGNPAWLDKYFDADGKPKGPPWWESIPIVGAPSKLIYNWSNGYPSEWSELGWAAVDVADGVLLVATWGGSAVVEKTIEEGGKKVAKTVMGQEAKLLAKQEARSAGRQLAEKAAQGTRAAAKRAPRSSMLRRIARSIAVAAETAASPVVRIGKMTWSISKQGAITIARVDAAWRSVPATVRKYVYRALLGVGLYYTLTRRTIPAIQAAKAEIETFIRNSPALLGEAIAKVLPDFLKPPAGFQRLLGYVIPVLLLSFLTWYMRPIARRVRYV